MGLRHGSLFSGIGGFDLAAEWMGWENIFHCEWNEFGQRVLKHYWPNADSLHDITKTDFTKYEGSIDIISGGFPCQPYSAAGKRLGKEDERHLWPEMRRAIREIKPTWVVGENVCGLVNWNGGLVFDEVQSDLEAEGYEVQPFLLPACAVNAPHRRDRIWFVAYQNTDINGRAGSERKEESEVMGFGYISTGDNERIRANNAKVRNATNSDSRGLEGSTKVGRNSIDVEWKSEFGDAADTGLFGQTERQKQTMGINKLCQEWNATNSERIGSPGKEYGQTQSGQHTKAHTRCWWQNFPTQPPICGGDDGIPRELDSITFPKWRNESIKAYGNAIVPQVALQIFKAIQEYENLKGGGDNN